MSGSSSIKSKIGTLFIRRCLQVGRVGEFVHDRRPNGFKRQGNHETGALPLFTLRTNFSAMRFNNLFTNKQTQPKTTYVAARGRACKPLEETRLLLLIHAGASI